MPKAIRYHETKAERKREREKIGRLRDQRITLQQPRTGMKLL